jgi:hypothetical protein
MSEQPLQVDLAGADSALVNAHARLRADTSLQFDRTDRAPPDIPDWFSWIADVIRALGPVLKVVFWLGLALIVGTLLYLVGREVFRLRAPKSKAQAPQEHVEPEWRPDAQAARDLLASADSLAFEGRYAEAAHLLLLRSVEDIEKRKARALKTSLTTREIANLASLPEGARPAFTLIGQVVERSLFGGRPVQAQDFADCRRAYETFALPAGWRA